MLSVSAGAALVTDITDVAHVARRWSWLPLLDAAQREKECDKEVERVNAHHLEKVVCFENNLVQKTHGMADRENTKDVSDPTSLFRYLQMKCWQSALEAVRDDPWQATVWISRGLDTTQSPRSITWKILPLHAR